MTAFVEQLHGSVTQIGNYYKTYGELSVAFRAYLHQLMSLPRQPGTVAEIDKIDRSLGQLARQRPGRRGAHQYVFQQSEGAFPGLCDEEEDGGRGRQNESAGAAHAMPPGVSTMMCDAFTTETASDPTSSPSSSTASVLMSETTRWGPHCISSEGRQILGLPDEDEDE